MTRKSSSLAQLSCVVVEVGTTFVLILTPVSSHVCSSSEAATILELLHYSSLSLGQ